MKILGKEIERYTLTNYVKRKPDNIWASDLQVGMQMINLAEDAKVMEIDNKTVITSNQIGSFILTFTHNPTESSKNLLYAGLHTIDMVGGMIGPPISIGEINLDLESIKDFIFDSIITLVKSAEADRKAGVMNVPNIVPMGKKGLLIMRMGDA